MNKYIYTYIPILIMGILLFSGCSATDKKQTQTTEKSETHATQSADTQPISKDELETLLLKQPLTITHISYDMHSGKSEPPHPTLLQAVIQNNTNENIKTAVIALVAWDENGLPVKIKETYDFTEGSYAKRLNCANIHLTGGATYQKKLTLPENNSIHTFKAVAVSYETYTGKKWYNPYYKMFCACYKGKKIQ